MTPGTFEYHRPASVAEAVGLLAQHGEAAQVLAGGHSLVPMMKLRLASPEHLVDKAKALKAVCERHGVELRAAGRGAGVGRAHRLGVRVLLELVVAGAPLVEGEAAREHAAVDGAAREAPRGAPRA